MSVPIFCVDAFTERPFAGNPAAVCILSEERADGWLQSVAAEMNLSETAFLRKEGDGWRLRWFTPTVEVDLCGHATLASAFVVFRHLEPSLEAVSFRSKSGELRVTRGGDLLTLDFPARPPARLEVQPGLVRALGAAPAEAWAARDGMAVYATEDEVLALKPDMEALAALDHFGVIVTAPGRASDFVSRFFAPRQGVPEDPVTGSAHCTLVPYWAKRLGKPRLHALQVSRRGGELFCEDRGDRVAMGGRAVQFLEGTIEV